MNSSIKSKENLPFINYLETGIKKPLYPKVKRQRKQVVVLPIKTCLRRCFLVALLQSDSDYYSQILISCSMKTDVPKKVIFLSNEEYL